MSPVANLTSLALAVDTTWLALVHTQAANSANSKCLTNCISRSGFITTLVMELSLSPPGCLAQHALQTSAAGQERKRQTEVIAFLAGQRHSNTSRSRTSNCSGLASPIRRDSGGLSRCSRGTPKWVGERSQRRRFGGTVRVNREEGTFRPSSGPPSPKQPSVARFSAFSSTPSFVNFASRRMGEHRWRAALEHKQQRATSSPELPLLTHGRTRER